AGEDHRSRPGARDASGRSAGGRRDLRSARRAGRVRGYAKQQAEWQQEAGSGADREGGPAVRAAAAADPVHVLTATRRSPMRLALALLTAGMLVAMLGEAAADPPRASVHEVKEDPKYVEGVQAVKRRDYPAAIRCFEDVVARDDRNANAYNWLGYSIRQSGDATRAIPVYEKALAIDPKHKGAHEYIGE